MAHETQKSKIERLEREVHELKQLNQKIHQDNLKLGQELSALSEQSEAAFRETPLYRQMAAEIDRLRVQNKLLERQAGKKSTHNARGAGRKANDKTQQAKYRQFSQLYSSGMSMEQIMEQMQISRTTFFRYKTINYN